MSNNANQSATQPAIKKEATTASVDKIRGIIREELVKIFTKTKDN